MTTDHAGSGGDSVTVHGTAVAIHGRAVLLIGPPGSGKSDLALRLTDAGALLVADDAVRITPCDQPQPGRCLAAALPGALGKLMVRDIGVIRLASHGLCVPACPLALVVELEDRIDTDFPFARLGQWSALADRPVPRISLPPFHQTSVRKVHLALERWGL